MNILDQCLPSKIDEATTRKDAAQCNRGKEDNPQIQAVRYEKDRLLIKYIDS
jgi:hypothetical protein